MTYGAGTIYADSMKQKINTLSSTHAELLGVSDALPKMLWCRYFMKAQGYIVEEGNAEEAPGSPSEAPQSYARDTSTRAGEENISHQ